MSASNRRSEPDTIPVYRDDLGVNHLPSAKEGMTRCGFDTEFMEYRDHPNAHAARWCHLCWKNDLGPSGDPE